MNYDTLQEWLKTNDAPCSAFSAINRQYVQHFKLNAPYELVIIESAMVDLDRHVSWFLCDRETHTIVTQGTESQNYVNYNLLNAQPNTPSLTEIVMDKVNAEIEIDRWLTDGKD